MEIIRIIILTVLSWLGYEYYFVLHTLFPDNGYYTFAFYSCILSLVGHGMLFFYWLFSGVMLTDKQSR